MMPYIVAIDGDIRFILKRCFAKNVTRIFKFLLYQDLILSISGMILMCVIDLSTITSSSTYIVGIDFYFLLTNIYIFEYLVLIEKIKKVASGYP